MDIRLIRRPHPNRMVRGSRITPTDPYLESCWLPVVGPSIVPLGDLSRLLGLGRVGDLPGRNNRLVRTIVRAEQFGLGFTSLGVAESATFGIHDHVALIPARLPERLPEVAWQRHVAAVEAANKTLTAAELPALRSPLPGSQGAAERLGAASTPEPVPAQPQRTLHAVPPIARLDAQASASAPAPELSL